MDKPRPLKQRNQSGVAASDLTAMASRYRANARGRDGVPEYCHQSRYYMQIRQEYSNEIAEFNSRPVDGEPNFG